MNPEPSERPRWRPYGEPYSPSSELSREPSVEILTTAGLSFSASCTKSGRVCALATWPEAGFSVQNWMVWARAGPLADAIAIAMSTARAGTTRISFAGICQEKAGHSPGRLSCKFNVLHSQIEENRFDQAAFLAVEIAPGLLLQHPDYIDQLLRGAKIARALSGDGIGNLAEGGERLGGESDDERGERDLGRIVGLPRLLARMSRLIGFRLAPRWGRVIRRWVVFASPLRGDPPGAVTGTPLFFFFVSPGVSPF